MGKVLSLVTFGAITSALTFHAFGASENKVEIKTTDGRRCFKSNGIPDHPTGHFPNRGNPNFITAQDIRVCITIEPTRGPIPQTIKGIIGIAINGVPFRPNTAGFWDQTARRGHSRRGNKNWSLDIFGAPGKLGLDFNNGHVGRGGMYHYHGIARSLTRTSGSSLVGYAGDGFEIHYLPNEIKSGWQLKTGKRPPDAPPGNYDGSFNEDYEYLGGKNRLDQCNGRKISGQYSYFITDNYPFVPRCLYGKISPDFGRGRHR